MTDAPITPTMRRMAKRIVEIELEDVYEGFKFKAWVNYPQSLTKEMQSQDEKRARAALMQIVLEHNFIDYDGADYPPANEEAFWDAIPNDLALATINAVQGQLGKLSKAPATR